jgi:hypothetical protein
LFVSDVEFGHNKNNPPFQPSLLFVLLRPDYASSYVNGFTRTDTNRTNHATHGLVWLRLLSVHQKEAHKRAAQMTRSARIVNMELTNDAMLRLISEYEKHAVLWDNTHKFYKLVNNENDAWEEIATEVGISVAEVKKKMNNDRN